MSKCWYCNNELTNGDSPKHFGICNKCYDKMFKSGDTIIRSFTNKISDLEAKLAESEEKVKHWHDLYNDRDKQFQSVRQRYHLLNKLQSNYDKKDKLHLAYMQCLELVEENEKLKKQLEEKEKIEYTDTINFVETSEPDIVAKELDRLNEQLAEKDKEIERLKMYDEYRFELPYPKVKILGKTFEDIQELIDKWIKQGSKDKISFAVEQLELAQKYIKQYVNNFDDMNDCLYAIDNQIKELKGDEVV